MKGAGYGALFFMYKKLKNLYGPSRVCIAKPHFLYKLPYLRKKNLLFY